MANLHQFFWDHLKLFSLGGRAAPPVAALHLLDLLARQGGPGAGAEGARGQLLDYLSAVHGHTPILTDGTPARLAEGKSVIKCRPQFKRAPKYIRP